jgi:AcrR family transcriptional regulator
MTKEKVRRGVSKAQWLEAAMGRLRDHSVADITVEGLAKELGIAKSGFYWHFKSREELLNALLDYWIHEITEVITNNVELDKLEPKARLTRCAEMIHELDLTRYEIGIRQFALRDEMAFRVVKKANDLRVDFIGKAFSELGFTGDDLEMRTMLFACYHTWEASMFQGVSRKRRKELIGKRLDLLTANVPSWETDIKLLDSTTR